MDETPFAVELAAGAPGDLVAQTPHSRSLLLAPGEPAPAGYDALVVLADGRRLAYAPTLEGPDAGTEVMPDPLMRGNAFVPAHQSARSLAALLSIAVTRRLETGPESERAMVFLRGKGLVFFQNGDTLKFEAGTFVVVPPGWPAAIWSQGPEDALAVVFQPQGQQVERRTLAGEIARRRQPSASDGSGGA